MLDMKEKKDVCVSTVNQDEAGQNTHILETRRQMGDKWVSQDRKHRWGRTHFLEMRREKGV